MRPNSKTLRTEPEYADRLVQSLRNKGMSIREIAEAIGVSKSRLEYIIAGKKRVPGTELFIPVKINYPEQFALEMLVKHF